MNNARSGKRKAKATPLPAQGTTSKKPRDEEHGRQAAYKASGAGGGAGAARAVAAGEAGGGVAAVEAEQRDLEERCERPVRISAAAAVGSAALCKA